MKTKDRETAETNTSTDSSDDAMAEQKGTKKANNKKVITYTSICVIVVAIILVFSLKGCTGCTASVSSTATPISSASTKATVSASTAPSVMPTSTPTATPEETNQTADDSGAVDRGSNNDQTYVAPANNNTSSNSGNQSGGCTVVHHEATGHYETQVVSEAYDEQVVATPAQQVPYYVCSDGTIWNTGKEASDHIDNDCRSKGSYSEAWKTIPATYTTIHHDAVTNQVWVVDSNAYDTCE